MMKVGISATSAPQSGTMNCPENASDKQLEAALRAFQRDNGLPDTGSADEATRQKLREKHGS